MSIAERPILENNGVAPGGGWSEGNRLSQDKKRTRKRHRHTDLEVRKTIQEDSSDDGLGFESLANKKQKKRTPLSENDYKNNDVSIKVNEDKVSKVETPSDQAESNKSTAKKIVATSKSSKSKKVYAMPGQKKDTPGELNGARIFYESLRQQNPNSKMAEEYLLKYGLLPYKEAAAIVKAQQELKGKAKSATKKKSNVEKSSTKTKGAKTKKKSKAKLKSGKSKSTKKKAKGEGRKKDTKKKNTKKALQLSSNESSSDESMIKNKKPRKSNKKSKRKAKRKVSKRK